MISDIFAGFAFARSANVAMPASAKVEAILGPIPSIFFRSSFLAAAFFGAAFGAGAFAFGSAFGAAAFAAGFLGSAFWFQL